MKDIHNHVDGIQNLNKIEFNDLKNYSTCLKVNIIKYPSGHQSLCHFLTTPYQGLYVDFVFPGQFSKVKDGKIIEKSCKDIVGFNGEKA